MYTLTFGAFSFAAGIASLLLAVYLAPHWKNKSAGRLILLMLSVAIWAMAYGMEFFSPTISQILWWVKLEYFGAAWTGFFTLFFILTITRKEGYLGKPLLYGLGAIPVGVILLVLTNESHHLIWSLAWMDFNGIIPAISFTRGPAFWIFVGYSYGLLLIATILLVASLIPARDLLKKQLSYVLAGITFPWIANIIYLIDIKGHPLPDLTPIAFTISGLAFARGLIQYQMLSLIPLAHEAIIESMGDPVIAMDSKDRILDANATAQRLFGLRKETLEYSYLSQALPQLAHALSGLDRSGPLEAEISLTLQNRETDWNLRTFPLLKSKRKRSGWLIILRDITEHKQSRQALIESERIHRTILEAAPNPIVLYDQHGQVTHINPAFTRIFGWEFNELAGKRIDFVPEESRESTRIALKKTLENQKVNYDFITQRLTKDKKTIDVSINSALCRTEGGSPTNMVVNFTDITKIKAAEKLLRNTRNYIRSIINSMPSILIGLDDKGVVTHWNREARRITGIKEDQAEGRELKTLFPRLADQITDIQNIIRDQKPQKKSRVPLSLSRTAITADITIFPLASETDQGVVVRVDDISERVKMEEMMVQSEKMLSVGGLAAGMAHEINNPLAGILQNIQVIENRLTRDIPNNLKTAKECGISLDSLREYLEKRHIFKMMALVYDSGQRAAEIVSNMLSFSRKSSHEKSPHHLNQLLDETIGIVQNDYRMGKQYDFKAIDILKEYADGLPPVTCQKGEIQQVLLNILKNGAEAMFNAGTPSPSLTLSLSRDKERVIIRIQDNGPGISPEIRKRIFEPFFTTKDVGEGTGLGLSVSYFIITENHKGSLAVESEPGQGTCFAITLPLKKHNL